MVTPAPDLPFDQAIADRFMRGNDRPEGIFGFLGIRLTGYEPGVLRAEMPVTANHLTMIGNMHGGCLAAYCDHLLGMVLYPHMAPGYWAATTEFKLNYMAPVSAGVCHAAATIVSLTKRTAVVHIEVHNEADGNRRLACMAQGTCLIVEPRK